jgi:hypothetical protein
MKETKFATLKNILGSLFVISMLFIMNTVTAEATPAKVTGLKQVDSGTTSVSLQWNSILGSDITYIMEYSQDKVNWVSERAYSNEDTIYSLNSGSTYFVRVKAVSDYYSSTASDGAYSDIVEVVTAPKATNQKITQTNATSSSVTISWNSVPGATAYDVYYYCSSISSDEIFVGTTSSTSVQIKKLPADTSILIYVYPRKKAATSPYYTTAASSSSYMYLSGVLTTPGKPEVVVTDRDPRKKIGTKKNSNYNTLEVSYSYASNADGYEVYVYNSKGKKIKTVKNTKAYSTSSTVKGIKTTDTVYVQVKPYTLINGSKKYGDASSKILSVGAPTAKVAKSGSGVKISWNKVTGAKKYEIYMSTSNKNYKKIKTVNANKKSVVITKFKGKKLKNYQTYYFYVKAVGKYGKKTAKSDTFYVNSFWFSKKYVY